LTPKELDEAMLAAGLGLSRDDFSDDGADLQDLKEIYPGGTAHDSYIKNDREAGRLSSHQY
jgi:hypothetical protein